MTLKDIGDRPTVARHITLHSVCLSGNGVDQEDAGRYRCSVYGIVSRHDGREILLLNQRLVGAEIELAHIPFIELRVAVMTVVLGVVGNIVLAGRHRFEIPGIIAHHPFHKATCQCGNQEGVLAVALGGTAPAWVSGRFNYG